MTNKLIASSPSLEGITKLINQYFYRDDITLTPMVQSPTKYIIMAGIKLFTDFVVVKQGKRYRFEMIGD